MGPVIKFGEKPEVKQQAAPVVDFVSYLLSVSSVIRMYHWKATYEPAHRALGSFYGDMNGILDSIAEKSMGKAKSRLTGFKDFPVSKYENTEPCEFLDSVKSYVQSVRYTIFEKEYSPIQNEIDNLVNLIDQTAYLLMFKSNG